MKKLIFALCFIQSLLLSAQTETPPMGFMTWNYFGVDFNENDIKSLADDLVSTGLRDLGYDYIFIDDGWQGGRDNRNNIIPDPQKFPSGIKALADYVHSKGLKLGIYSDAAPLTCAGYTASLNFEEQDAKTFADWGIDYLKYDYCGAPADSVTAKKRYKKMSDALKKTNRNIVFSICEWGDRKPWHWAKNAGGTLWRTSADIRDKWKATEPYTTPEELHRWGAGILDILNINAPLDEFAGNGYWNDPDMLVAGLYGKKGAPSTELNGHGCTDTEYQSQMSLWSLMASPLMISLDLKSMTPKTKEILMNPDVIAIDQDALGKQAKRVIFTEKLQVFVKPLANGDVAIGVLNTEDKKAKVNLDLTKIGVKSYRQAKDLWSKKSFKIRGNSISLNIQPHETILLRLSK
ncbi:glycoside hydrolase family 27 protein [Ornithobacterium rhinotracheale]|uniref:glycoside hydrolase family 27 protein n=1 Tax=Ornithobacterium rhinotracheale TaxID=28251 RepID=UPI004035F459